MLASTKGLEARRLGGAILLAAAIVIGMAGLGPSAARAAGCTDSWTNTAGGSWYTGTNWSKGTIPASGEEACITATGTYTVSMSGGSGASVAAVTIGGTSGTQTLEVASVWGSNPVLSATSGLSTNADGALTLTAASCGGGPTITGPVSNGGLLTVAVGDNEGFRRLNGNLTNTGTVQVNYNASFEGSKTTFTNEGALKVAEGHKLVMEAESSFVNGTGGSIAASGSGFVAVEPHTAFTEGAGTTSGTQPVLIREGALSYTGSGASSIAVRDTTTLKGNLASGQSLALQSECGENTHVEATESIKSAGAITLAALTCGGSTNLEAKSGTITNTGSITTLAGDKEGSRLLTGSFTNTGTIAVEYPTTYEGNSANSGKEGTLLNEGGTLTISAAKMTVPAHNTVSNASGAINVSGEGGLLQLESLAAFIEGAGTTGGTDVPGVLLRGASLEYTGSGASTIAVRDGVALSGSTSAGQNLALQSACGENTTVKASTSWSNAGAITLTSVSCAGNTDLETVAPATLTSTGSITVQKGDNEGSRLLVGNLDNKGTLTSEYATSYEGTGGKEGTLTNEGTLKLEGVTLKVAGGNAVVNQSGEIAATGSGLLQEESGASFTEGGGKTSGTQPVLLRGDALKYTGSGASAIAVRDTNTLSGNISAGQSLTLQSACGENTIVKAAASWSNAGAISLTSVSCGGSTDLETVAPSTLTSTGSITVQKGDNEGSRLLVGNLTNKGALTIPYATSYEGKASPGLVNEGTLTIEGVTLKVLSGNAVVNGGGEIAAGSTGEMLVESGSFTEGGGKTGGTHPVVLQNTNLAYTGKGASTIDFRGTGTLTGEVGKGQTLIVSSVCGLNTTVTASAVKNVGTVKMTSESCGGSTRFLLGAGVFTNDGKLYIEAGDHEGSREIEGELLNEKSLLLVGYTLKVTGKYTQGKKGTFEPYINSNSEFGVLSASGTATIIGKLKLKQGKKFTPPEGQSFEVLKASSRSGEFTSVSGNKIKKSTLLYVPHYTATGMKLIVEP